MLKTILLLFSFLITLLELQARAGVLKGKVADADTRAPHVSASATNKVTEVFMEKNDESLTDVVVIGYGRQQKKDITSAISSIPGNVETLSLWGQFG